MTDVPGSAKGERLDEVFAGLDVAPLGILVSLAMTLFLPLDTWIRLGVWLVIGLVIYASYGLRHSALRGTAADPAA